jgi:hypothetical protein
MPLQTIVRSTDRWTITDVGRSDLRTCEQCRCQVKVAGVLVECRECGTVYGYLQYRRAAAQHEKSRRD